MRRRALLLNRSAVISQITAVFKRALADFTISSLTLGRYTKEMKIDCPAMQNTSQYSDAVEKRLGTEPQEAVELMLPKDAA